MGEIMKHLIWLLAITCLVGCAGSAYKLPEVNEADVQAMEKRIADNQKPLITYNRSEKRNRQMVDNAAKRLIKHAKPLCKHAGYESCSFNVVYKPDDTFNAFASGNNDITIYRGLIKYLKNDDEVAAVVAHEMGHHLANHIEEKTQNAVTGAAISGILTAVLIGAANANNPYYSQYQAQQDQQTVENMMSAGAGIGALSYSKEQEREADLLATYLLALAGYNLKRAQNIMMVLANEAGESAASRTAFLDSHPAGIERFVAWEKAIEEVKNNKSKLPYIKEKSVQKNKKATFGEGKQKVSK
jgi:predicted Zn-dependent protease